MGIIPFSGSMRRRLVKQEDYRRVASRPDLNNLEPCHILDLPEEI